MITKVGGPESVKDAGKTKSAKKASQTGGPRFADLLETDAAADTSPAHDSLSTPYSPPYPSPETSENLQKPPSYARLLQTLEGLAADILTATPSKKAQELQQVLDNLPQDRSTYTAAQNTVLDELATRAAATLAQLKK